MKRYLSIDIGGTAIKYGLMTETADILEKHEMATEAHQGGPAILEKVKSLVATYQEAGLAGVAISSAGMVDPDKGNIFMRDHRFLIMLARNLKRSLKRPLAFPARLKMMLIVLV